MRALLMRIRIKIFGEPDVGNALKHLNKAVRKVDAAAAYHADKADAMARAAEAARRSSEHATRKAAHATKVGSNLSNLLALDEDPDRQPAPAETPAA